MKILTEIASREKSSLNVSLSVAQYVEVVSDLQGDAADGDAVLPGGAVLLTEVAEPGSGIVGCYLLVTRPHIIQSVFCPAHLVMAGTHLEINHKKVIIHFTGILVGKI